MVALNDLPSPKRDQSSTIGRAGWYPYYAGFSAKFADSIFARFVKRDCSVLDPWNGSGTTTAVAAGLGNRSFGFDLNPVMVIVARARLLNKRERSSLLPLAKLFLTTPGEGKFRPDDPLRLWFRGPTVRYFRCIEASLQMALMGKKTWTPMEQHLPNEISDLTAFFYVALFRTVRSLLTAFQASNPTWLKVPDKNSRRLVSERTIQITFIAQVSLMVAALDNDAIEKDGKVRIEVATSENLPLGNDLIDFVLSSPPYCTRIDYAAATRAELAILGLSADKSFDSLRRKLIGTPTVPQGALEVSPEWGPACGAFLDKVKNHPSKASGGYYLKSHCQYFKSIFASLRELTRCLKKGGKACLVVQDSFYKDVHNDLPTMYTEMCRNLGMASCLRQDFTSTRTMGRVNTFSKRYRSSKTPIESVLVFEKN